MLFVFISTMVIVASLSGAGALFGRIIRMRQTHNPWIFLWLGFAIAGTGVVFVSFFTPINLVCLLVFFSIGFAGLPFFYRNYKQAVYQTPRAEKIIFGLLALVFMLFIANRLSHVIWPGSYDTDLYHAQIVRWYNEYGAVLGLGNIHTRLAFNSTWLSFAALLDNGIWDNKSEWIMPAFVWLGAFLYFAHELCFSRNKGARLYSAGIMFWILAKTYSMSPGLYYDAPVHIINAIVVLEIWMLFSARKPDGNYIKDKTNNAACAFVLSCSAFSIKPMGAVSVIFAGIAALYVLISSRQRFLKWVVVFLPAGCILGVWIARNIFTSGFPFYPVPVFPLSFDWTMPFNSAKSNYDSVLAWARIPGANAHLALNNGFFWIKPWLVSKLPSFDFLLNIGLPSALAAFLWLSLLQNSVSFRTGFVIKNEKEKKTCFFFAWVFLCIVYWFVSAPDPRFGDGFFWVFLGTSFLCMYQGETSNINISSLWNNKKKLWLFLYLCGMLSIGLIGQALASGKRSLISVGTMPSMPVKEWTVNVKVPWKIWIPEDGSEDRAGNPPLPSAPGPISNVEMRVPGNLGKGFRPVH
jgi:hypothetical protein